jgi:hypothetical protein
LIWLLTATLNIIGRKIQSKLNEYLFIDLN